MGLREKRVLKTKGESAKVGLKDLKATLFWKTSSDLDLHCMYKTVNGDKGHIYFGKKGSLTSAPFIKLDGDAGVGNAMAVNGNEENIHFGDLSVIEELLIVANVYGGGVNFAELGGTVTVSFGNEDLVVPLNSNKRSKWCTVAAIKKVDGVHQLVNINEVSSNKPEIGLIVPNRGVGGFFRGLFS